MKARRILAAVLGSAMVLTMAGAVFATDLHQETPITIGDELAKTQDCTEDELGWLDDADATVAWHFILIDPDSDTGQLHAVFSDPADEQTVDQWKVTGDAMHFYVFNDSLTLESAETVGVDGTILNLSHTCAIPAPTPTPTLPPTNTLPATPAAPSGTSMNLVLGLILLVAGGFTAYAMRPRRSTR
jgi:hypothetical protein